jgi:hypothetical protein
LVPLPGLQLVLVPPVADPLRGFRAWLRVLALALKLSPVLVLIPVLLLALPQVLLLALPQVLLLALPQVLLLALPQVLLLALPQVLLLALPRVLALLAVLALALLVLAQEGLQQVHLRVSRVRLQFQAQARPRALLLILGLALGPLPYPSSFSSCLSSSLMLTSPQQLALPLQALPGRELHQQAIVPLQSWQVSHPLWVLALLEPRLVGLRVPGRVPGLKLRLRLRLHRGCRLCHLQGHRRPVVQIRLHLEPPRRPL